MNELLPSAFDVRLCIDHKTKASTTHKNADIIVNIAAAVLHMHFDDDGSRFERAIWIHKS